MDFNDVKVGEFYAHDHVKDENTTETVVMLIKDITQGKAWGKDSNIAVTESMDLTNWKFELIYTNEWIPEFIERKATPGEIKLFKQERAKVEHIYPWQKKLLGDLWLDY
ncbi:hypothetical protein ACTHQ4_10375 [Alkalicoccobacillus gibsonii]|uniref:hypothetical protein n=1 Tax=Alkalicoccobacillus gibsonii TaxID=79881 RepID=UPI003F7C84C1